MTQAKRTRKTTTKPAASARKTTATRKKVSTTPKPKTTVTATKTATAIPDLPVNPFTFEVFDVVSKQETNAGKVKALQKFEHDSLKALLSRGLVVTMSSKCRVLRGLPTALIICIFKE